MAARSDLAAEMVRLNEALGATRVQIRQDIAGFAELKGALGRGAGESVGSLQAEIGEEIGERLSQARRKVHRGAGKARRRIAAGDRARTGESPIKPSRRGGAAAAAGAESVAAEVRNEVKATHKALTGLAKKFERFDDKISVQVKDQDQRLRKLERSARG